MQEYILYRGAYSLICDLFALAIFSGLHFSDEYLSLLSAYHGLIVIFDVTEIQFLVLVQHISSREWKVFLKILIFFYFPLDFLLLFANDPRGIRCARGDATNLYFTF